MSRGIFYVAVGHGSYGEARRSAASAKRHMPTMPIHIYTDMDLSRVDRGVFDSVAPILPYVPGFEDLPLYPHNGLLCKSYWLRDIPFDCSLFLDTDTYVCSDLDDMFWLVEGGRFDIALAHDSGRLVYEKLNIRPSFPVFNTGVILMRRCAVVRRILQNQWATFAEEVRDNDNWSADQSMWQGAIYRERSCRVATLPPEYNFRWIFPAFAGGPLRIIHGHGEFIEKVQEIVDVTHEPRVWHDGRLVGFHAISNQERLSVQKRLDTIYRRKR